MERRRVFFLCVSLTSIVLVEGVHAGEVDGQRLEGRGQADAALGALHVQARRRARVGRLGQARLGILHAEYGSRRLGRLSAATHGRSTSPRNEEKEKKNPNTVTPTKMKKKNPKKPKKTGGRGDSVRDVCVEKLT